MQERPCIVFDCDGTLTDSHHVIVESMIRAFDARGVTAPSDRAIRGVIGLSLPIAIARLAPDLSEAELEAMVDAYKDGFAALRQSGAIKESLYPGVRTCLEALTKRGARLGIATGKSRRGLDHLLDTHDLRGFFQSLQCADGNFSKPHPQMLEKAMGEMAADPRQTVMVGDSPYDIQMAVAAGTQSVGVAWSDHGPDALVAAGANAILDSYETWQVLLAHWETV